MSRGNIRGLRERLTGGVLRPFALVVVGPVAWSCVPGAPHHPSRDQVVVGPPLAHVTSSQDDPRAALRVLQPRLEAGCEAEVSSGQVAVSGYQHWDGVRYVWVPTKAQSATAPYSWLHAPRADAPSHPARSHRLPAR